VDPIFSFVGLGAFAGVLAGLLGVGGGLVIVPVLIFLFQSQGMNPSVIVHLAIGTSLATILVTSLSSVWAHHRRGAVLWPIVLSLAPGIVFGTWLGAEIVHHLPSKILQILFGIFELVVAAQIGFGFRPSPHRSLPRKVGMWGVGGVIGFISGIMGIGGGSLTVPFLLWCNVAVRNAVAISAACGVPIAAAGSLGFMAVGLGVSLPPHSTGYLYWPAWFWVSIASLSTAPLGAWLAHTVPTESLKRFFALFLVFLGIHMLGSVYF